jgi:hypothetical protein
VRVLCSAKRSVYCADCSGKRACIVLTAQVSALGVFGLGVLCACIMLKTIFDGLAEDVEDDKACLRDGVYRGPE